MWLIGLYVWLMLQIPCDLTLCDSVYWLGQRLDNQFDYQQEQRIFLLATDSGWLCGLPTGYWVHIVEVKWSGSEADQSPAFCSKIRNVWCCTYTLLYVSMAWCWINPLELDLNVLYTLQKARISMPACYCACCWPTIVVSIFLSITLSNCSCPLAPKG